MEPLPEGLPSALLEGAAHPLDPDAGSGVDHIQTHISHVFLTRRHVYKLHKAVDLGFLSFATRAERNADALRELRLNRRLSPDVYLGICEVEPHGDDERAPWQLGPVRPDPEALAADREHCIAMRRLPEGRDALSLLERGALTAAQMDRVACTLAAFHRSHGLGAPAPFSAQAWQTRIAEPITANFDVIEAAGAPVVPPEELAALRRASDAALARLAPRLERRRVEGRAVDGHGDLHLQHIWFVDDDAEPLVIDCLAFSEALRRIDAASELAFLAMDLGYRGAESLAARVLARYALESDDYDLYGVVDFYHSYRAAVRGKVAAIAAADAEIPADRREASAQSARRHVAAAREALVQRPPGDVWLVGGPVGTGKTSVAHELADATGAVVIASDRVRKAEAGLAASDRLSAAPGRGAYTDEHRARVYTAMLERAAPVVDAGRAVILDATWSHREQRDAARELAAARGVACRFVHVQCAVGVAAERVAARSARDDDASDAGPELVEASARSFETPGEWPELALLDVRTDVDGWRVALARSLSDRSWIEAHDVPPSSPIP